jgi:hypothetical protein
VEYELKFRASAQTIMAVSKRHLGVGGLLGTTREDLSEIVQILVAKQSIVSGNRVAVVGLGVSPGGKGAEIVKVAHYLGDWSPGKIGIQFRSSILGFLYPPPSWRHSDATQCNVLQPESKNGLGCILRKARRSGICEIQRDLFKNSANLIGEGRNGS